MIVPLLGEAEATVPGAGNDGADIHLHLKIGNAEWVLAERALGGISYLDIVTSMVAAELNGKSISLDTSRTVLWAATRRHNDKLTIDECGELITQFGPIVMAALGEAIRGSIKIKGPEQGEAVPAKAPAKKKSGIGTAS